MTETRRRVLLVTGSGRSGTSTVAGALARLGLYIPPPLVEADETNPRGFYESQWVVDFHKELLSRAPVRTIDARPEAAALAARAAADPQARERLVNWLAEQDGHAQVLVKDPRAFWLHDVWRAAVPKTGRELAFLTMLRHPVEVAGSRDSAYLADETPGFRRQRATANVAAWVNGAFETEVATRGERAFVRHLDLLADWRGALGRAAEQLELTLDPAGDAAVDDFIDTRLHRARIDWDELDVPDELRDLAERAWELMNALVDSPQDAAVAEELAGLRERYARLHDHAVAIAIDHTKAREAHVRRTVRANVERELGARTEPRRGLFRRS
ncbi:sulfotransferase family protein [Nocardioides sp. cx-173]|uniref:sulfotransferase family protein n=1 Tax=Nocardioides sp. cx-173 TaxID=2898796 RepID=UPI001E5FA55F|nr:sulfotransferase [Nocardioides sp. cx-173]MCD4526708.1 sulfotransferase [Nocardioides sp. cx-173]UGB42550.1 sulfotransferase [Nocardioides sp. cx-173]